MSNELLPSIRAACHELERALEDFEQTDSVSETNANRDDIKALSKNATAQLQVIHERLLDIRRQLDELS